MSKDFTAQVIYQPSIHQTDDASQNAQRYQVGDILAVWPVAEQSTFDTADAAYTASGGSITARFAYLVDTTTTPDEVVAHTLLDNSPADVTVTDTNTLTVQINVSGVFTET